MDRNILSELRSIHEHPSGPRTDCDACWLLQHITNQRQEIDNAKARIGNLINQNNDLRRLNLLMAGGIDQIEELVKRSLSQEHPK